MLSRRVGGFRPFARAGAIASIALIGMLLSANAAFAVTTVIGLAAGNTTCSASAGFDTVQISSSAASYAVPVGGGSIASWSTQGGPGVGQVGLQVWRLTATAGTYQLVGAGPLETPVAGIPNTFTVAPAIAVQEGDVLGLRVEGHPYCDLYLAGTPDTWGGHMGATPGVLGTAAFGNNAGTLDVEATVDATVITPPPPPPSGCDSTGNSANTVADTSASVAVDESTAAPADTSNVDSTDKSAKDATDKSKKDKSAKDQSTGGGNCQQ